MPVLGYRFTSEPPAKTLAGAVKDTIKHVVSAQLKTDFIPAYWELSLKELQKNSPVKPLQMSRQILLDLHAYPRFGKMFQVIPDNDGTVKAFAEATLGNVANTIIVWAMTGTAPNTAVS